MQLGMYDLASWVTTGKLPAAWYIQHDKLCGWLRQVLDAGVGHLMATHDAEVLQPNQLAEVLPDCSVIHCHPAEILILVKLSLLKTSHRTSWQT